MHAGTEPLVATEEGAADYSPPPEAAEGNTNNSRQSQGAEKPDEIAVVGPSHPDFESAMAKIPPSLRNLLYDRLRGDFKYLGKYPPGRFADTTADPNGDPIETESA